MWPHPALLGHLCVSERCSALPLVTAEEAFIPLLCPAVGPLSFSFLSTLSASALSLPCPLLPALKHLGFCMSHNAKGRNSPTFSCSSSSFHPGFLSDSSALTSTHLLPGPCPHQSQSCSCSRYLLSLYPPVTTIPLSTSTPSTTLHASWKRNCEVIGSMGVCMHATPNLLLPCSLTQRVNKDLHILSIWRVNVFWSPLINHSQHLINHWVL